MARKIKPVYKRILDKIRELYVESGGELLNSPEDYGLNTLFKSTGGIEVIFDYDTPHWMYTPEGCYTILGDNVVGDTKRFWELFNQAFDVEVLIPRISRERLGTVPGLYGLLGPYVRISERTAYNSPNTESPLQTWLTFQTQDAKCVR